MLEVEQSSSSITLKLKSELAGNNQGDNPVDDASLAESLELYVLRNIHYLIYYDSPDLLYFFTLV